jgi:hypothetical protein
MNTISSLATNDPISAIASGSRRKGTDRLGEDFDTLQRAIDSGDLGAAKSAFSSLQASIKNAPSAPDGEANAISAAGAKQGPDFTALAKALDSGDLSAAKTALTDIQKKRAHKADSAGASNALSSDAFMATLTSPNQAAPSSGVAAASASRDPFGVSGQAIDIHA